MLTKREADVLKLLCEGFPENDIAKQLGISVGTVKRHLQHVYLKYGFINSKLDQRVALVSLCLLPLDHPWRSAIEVAL